ncbi:MAG TPA: winged helix-turn-helix domain-containing protein [Pyrinomonadaceae bacterium]|nr:winged helix-turn-helix domain-containing protein [Pyrinomonadaceae bacterium]
MSDLGKDRESSPPAGYLYRFGQFALDSRKRTVSCADSPVALTPKAFDVLLFLVQNPNRLVTKEELLQAVWGDTFVEEGNLTQYISHLRKALGDHAEDARLIVTIARKGYQFTGEVAVAEAGDTTKQIAVEAPATETSRADAQPVHEIPVKEAVRKAPRRGWRAAIVGAFALILVVAGYMVWRHFRVGTPPATEKIMLAVLPFANLTGDPSKEYLADGLTEEMISQLARLNPERLGVIARTSVMGYKNKDTRLDQIGRDLSVQYVLENSVRANGNQIRLTAQLIQVKDQTHVWAQSYDYLAKDFLNVEDEVAKAVAREVQLRLTSHEQARMTQTHPVNPEAFEAYFQGRYSAQDPDVAAKYFERATQLDPNYALAWVWLARTRFRQVDSGRVPTEEGQRLAREAAERALALDPNLAAANATMGGLKRTFDFDWAGGDAYFQRALALEPSNPEILTVAANAAAESGRFNEALRLMRRAVELDPLNANLRAGLGQLEYWGGAPDEGIVDLKRALELNPKATPRIVLAEIYVIQGRPQDALAEIEQLRPGSPYRLQQSAIAYHGLGREKESDAALQELIAKYQTIAAFQIAEVHAFRNEPDKAFEWLDRAYAQRDVGLALTKVSALLKNLHGDPRYAALLKKLNFPN